MIFQVQQAAELDILGQIEWYAEKDLTDIASRFSQAVAAALDGLMNMPTAGTPKPMTDARLGDLRTWPVNGFDEFRIYYLFTPGLLTVIRVLHGKRDIARILQSNPTEAPGC